MIGELVRRLRNGSKWERISVLGEDYTVRNHWFWKEYREAGWEPQTLATYRRWLSHDTTYVDVGAWVGLTVMYAKEIGVREAYAIEANPETYALTAETFRKNRKTRDVDFSHVCIADKDGGVVDFGGYNGNSLSSASSMRGHDWKVPATTLLTWLKDKRLDAAENLFLKVDIEGAEALAMSDLTRLGTSRHLVVYLSLHPTFMDDPLETWSKLAALYAAYRHVYNSRGDAIAEDDLKRMFLSKEKFPAWGTKFGNFFEITLTSF